MRKSALETGDSAYSICCWTKLLLGVSCGQNFSDELLLLLVFLYKRSKAATGTSAKHCSCNKQDVLILISADVHSITVIMFEIEVMVHSIMMMFTWHHNQENIFIYSYSSVTLINTTAFTGCVCHSPWYLGPTHILSKNAPLSVSSRKLFFIPLNNTTQAVAEDLNPGQQHCQSAAELQHLATKLEGVANQERH